MPDLQTELSKVINAWDSDTAPQTQATQTTQPQPQENQMDTSKSISEQVFQYVQAFPGYKTNEYAHRLKPALNFNTIKTLINQMVRAGHMRKDPDGRIEAVINKYRPIPSNKKLQAKKKKPESAYKVVHMGTNTKSVWDDLRLKEKPTSAITVAAPRTDTLTADYVMAHISIAEGKKLFTLLSDVF